MAGPGQPATPLRVLVAGMGSIGRRHLQNLRALQPDLHVTVFRPRTQAPPDLPCDEVLYHWEQVLAGRYDAAILATPAPQHVPAALALARAHVHLFIEKPLSDSLAGVEELLELGRRNGRVLMVGYNLRFHRPLQVLRRAIEEGRIGRVLSARAEVGQWLPDWRSGQDVRDSISGRRDLGGGVVLELSHEIDCLRWLVGSEVCAVSAQMGHVSDLPIDVEDVAEITLRFANGALGHAHLDMLQRPPARACRIIGATGQLAWDAQSQAVRWCPLETGVWTELPAGPAPDRNDMYVEELRHFLQCVREGRPPPIDGAEGRRTLEVALAAKRAAAEGREVRL